MRKTVYIAGPYSGGDVMLNIRNAVWIADRIWEYGGAYYLPHLSGLHHIISPQEYEVWMERCMVWLEKCNALFRLAGPSPGSDREVARAEALGIPVFYDLGKLKAWLQT